MEQPTDSEVAYRIEALVFDQTVKDIKAMLLERFGNAPIGLGVLGVVIGHAALQSGPTAHDAVVMTVINTVNNVLAMGTTHGMTMQ